MSKKGLFRFILSIVLVLLLWLVNILGLGWPGIIATAIVLGIIFVSLDSRFLDRSKKPEPPTKWLSINFLLIPATIFSIIIALYVTNYELALAIILTVILPAGIVLNDKYQQR